MSTNASDWLRRGADAALEATVVGSWTHVGLRARRALFHWDDEAAADLHGRVAVVTGATGGIGLATADALVARGAAVWLVGRDPDRTEEARRRVASAHPQATVATVLADLASLDDVRRCADRIVDAAQRLDVLVHNAGALTHDLQFADAGVELTAQVQVVAPFLLTARLLPLLRATDGARVVTVSSGGMYTQRLDLGQFTAPAVPFDGVRAYANAKRAQVVLNECWTRADAARGVTFLAAHPGWADTPGVQASLPRFRSIMRPLLRTPEQGADTIVWLAGTDLPADANGSFWFDRRRRGTTRLPWTRTPAEDARELWEWCVERAEVANDLAPAR